MHDLLDLKAILVVALIFVPLEILVPLYRDQKLLRKHWFNDVLYLLLNGILINFGLIFVLGAAAAAFHLAIPVHVPALIQSQPLWLQIIEVVIVADIGFYIAHRCFHAFPVLWKFHAVHHSIEELDWLAAYRVHPVDQILTKGASLLPLVALGFSDSAILVFALIYKWQSVAIHSNCRISLGPLEWIVASPRFHRWHHANERAAFDKNFAGQLPLIDLIGGTLFLPKGTPEKYGTDHPVPERYPEQLAYPLRELFSPESLRTAGEPR
ncbi:MAG TPA: sterol desaturase family protein [Rhizomicrobium sp.]|jgi:sterol desaturase/sphingolipid hydroxylase (fatty acid hydroxylase superfamily)